MAKRRVQIRTLDIYRLIVDGQTDKISFIDKVNYYANDKTLEIIYYKKQMVYEYNTDNIDVIRKSVKSINKMLKQIAKEAYYD